MSLYTYRSTGYVTKWDHDGNVEASYQVSDEGCTCPAGHRPICRHRTMLPNLRPIADTHWFWNHDLGIVVDLMGTPKSTIDALVAPTVPAGLPAGVQIFGMDDLLGIHNAIADAVGEPEARLEQTVQPPTPGVATWRRI